MFFHLWTKSNKQIQKIYFTLVCFASSTFTNFILFILRFSFFHHSVVCYAFSYSFLVRCGCYLSFDFHVILEKEKEKKNERMTRVYFSSSTFANYVGRRWTWQYWSYTPDQRKSACFLLFFSFICYVKPPKVETKWKKYFVLKQIRTIWKCPFNRNTINITDILDFLEWNIVLYCDNVGNDSKKKKEIHNFSYLCLKFYDFGKFSLIFVSQHTYICCFCRH